MYRIVFGSQEYQFERFREEQKDWRAVEEPRTMRQVRLEPWSITALNAQGEPIQTLLLSPNQESVEFTIVLSSGEEVRTLHSTQEGQLRIIHETP